MFVLCPQGKLPAGLCLIIIGTEGGPRACGGIGRPGLRQVKRAVDEGMPFIGGISREHTDLAVRDLPAEPVYCRATPHEPCPV